MIRRRPPSSPALQLTLTSLIQTQINQTKCFSPFSSPFIKIVSVWLPFPSNPVQLLSLVCFFLVKFAVKVVSCRTQFDFHPILPLPTHQGQPSLQSVTHSEGEQKKERFLIKRFHVKLMHDGRWIHWLLKATLSTKTRIDEGKVYLTFWQCKTIFYKKIFQIIIWIQFHSAPLLHM